MGKQRFTCGLVLAAHDTGGPETHEICFVSNSVMDHDRCVARFYVEVFRLGLMSVVVRELSPLPLTAVAKEFHGGRKHHRR